MKGSSSCLDRNRLQARRQTTGNRTRATLDDRVTRRTKVAWIQHKFGDLFAIDVRTLAFFRIVLSATVLVDLALRVPSFDVFVTTAGVLAHQPSTPSVYFFAPRWVPEWTVFCLGAVSTICLLFGYKTRTSGVLSWLFLVSLQRRNPWVVDDADTLLLQLHFWGLLLPWGSCFSFDARSARPDQRDSVHSSRTILSAASAGLLLQPAVVYFSSVFHKIKGAPWRDGTAVAQALAHDGRSRPLGLWIIEHEALSMILTYATLAVEFLAPLLLFSLWKTNRARGLGVFLLLGLQAALALSLRIGLFPLFMTVALVPFIPASFWDRWWRHGHTTRTVDSGTIRLPSPFALQLVGVAALTVVVLSNMDNLTSRITLAKYVQKSIEQLGLNQSWNMYAPHPMAINQEIKTTLHLSDGRTIVIADGHPERFEPLQALWDGYRGENYLESVAYWMDRPAREDLAAWIRRQWQEQDERNRVVLGLDLTLVEWKRGTEDRREKSLVTWRSPGEKSEI